MVKTFSTFAAALAVRLADGILDSLTAHTHPITPVTPTAEYVILRKIPSLIDTSVTNAVQRALRDTQNGTCTHPSSPTIVSATTTTLLKTALQSHADNLKKTHPRTLWKNAALQFLNDLKTVIALYSAEIPNEVVHATISRISELYQRIHAYYPACDCALESTSYVAALHTLADEIQAMADSIQ